MKLSCTSLMVPGQSLLEKAQNLEKVGDTMASQFLLTTVSGPRRCWRK